MCDLSSAPMQRLLGELPRNSLRLLVAGAPCQQLTTMGPYRGRLGLCGLDSRHLFAVPYIAHLIQTLRSDARVHVLIENAASMLPMHWKG
eukprot:6361468-Prorocentrum_lima.AAC.1